MAKKLARPNELKGGDEIKTAITDSSRSASGQKSYAQRAPITAQGTKRPEE